MHHAAGSAPYLRKCSCFVFHKQQHLRPLFRPYPGTAIGRRRLIFRCFSQNCQGTSPKLGLEPSIISPDLSYVRSETRYAVTQIIEVGLGTMSEANKYRQNEVLRRRHSHSRVVIRTTTFPICTNTRILLVKYRIQRLMSTHQSATTHFNA